MGILQCINSIWSNLTQTFHSLSTLQKTGVVLAVAVSVHMGVKRFYRDHTPPPGPVRYPLAAHLPATGRKSHIVLMELRDQYGDVFQIQMGECPTVVISGQLIQEALVGQGDAFSGRPQLSTVTASQNELTTLTFGKFDHSWTVHRGIATDVLVSFLGGRSELLENIIYDELDTLVREFKDQNKSSFDPNRLILLAVASIGFQICYGKRKNVHTDKDFLEYIKLNGKPANAGNSIPWVKLIMQKKPFDIKKLIKHGETVRHRLVTDHIKTFKDRTSRDLLDGLIKAAACLKDDDKRIGVTGKRVLGTIGDFFAGALDTMHAILSWSLLLLTVYNRMQVKIQKELDDTVGRTRLPNLTDRDRLPYLQATIHEILRFACVTPLSIPHTATRDVNLGGYTIRKDTRVFVNLYSLSHDPELWGDPTSFRPERFLTETGSVKTSLLDRFLPFSAGQRKCIGEPLAGAEIFLLLSGLLHRCSLVRAGDVPSYSLQPGFGVNQKPLPYKIQVQIR